MTMGGVLENDKVPMNDAAVVRSMLSESTFKRNPWRLGYGVAYSAIILALIMAVKAMDPHWLVKVMAGFLIGQLLTGICFLAHEILHGSVVKNRSAQDALGLLFFSPFLSTPTYWRHWHNILHHGNVQNLLYDPDVFPTASVFKNSRFMQRIFDLTPGSGSPVSYLYLFYWFSMQCFLNQFV